MVRYSAVLILFLCLISPLFFGCEEPLCPESPNCIPGKKVDGWRLEYKPVYGDCMECHTRCTHTSRSDLKASHSFCSQGEAWNSTVETCKGCHKTVKNHSGK